MFLCTPIDYACIYGFLSPVVYSTNHAKSHLAKFCQMSWLLPDIRQKPGFARYPAKFCQMRDFAR